MLLLLTFVFLSLSSENSVALAGPSASDVTHSPDIAPSSTLGINCMSSKSSEHCLSGEVNTHKRSPTITEDFPSIDLSEKKGGGGGGHGGGRGSSTKSGAGGGGGSHSGATTSYNPLGLFELVLIVFLIFFAQC